MENLLADLRHAFRVFRKSPGFTAIAIAALALGIGANTAIFSVINVVLLKPLPYPEPDRIMQIARKFPGGTGGSSSIPKFNVWKNNDAFEAMAAFDFGGVGMSVGASDHAEQVKGIHVSSEYFKVFGVSPTLGRSFTADEDLPNGPRVAVVSFQLFSRRMGGDLRLVGQPIDIAGAPTTVVGVLPATFQSEPPADIFIPLQADPNSINQGHYLMVAGRLKPGVTIASAQAAMKIAGERFRQANPKWMDKTESVGVVPFQDAMVGDVRLPLLILLGAVGFVLLIACANVANLQLARAATRQREMAIRTAIGANRWRIVRQLLTESVLLGLGGGVLGFLIGALGMRALLAIAPGDLPRINDSFHAANAVSALDWRVLCFTVAISLATGILFGLFPAVHVSRLDVNSALKDTSGRSGTGRHQNRARGFLVVSEIALAVILLVGAALMIRTFASLRAVNPGFDPHNVLTLQTSLSGGRYGSTAQVDSLIRQMTPRLESLPGVQSAATALMLPIEGGVDLPFNIAGKPPAKGNMYNGDEQWRSVSAHYFTAFKIPLLRGRVFSEHDSGNSARVIVINEAMAKKYWQKEDPIGQSMTLGAGLGPDFEEPARTIVGIVGNVRENGLTDANQGVMYVPAGQVANGLTRLILRPQFRQGLMLYHHRHRQRGHRDGARHRDSARVSGRGRAIAGFQIPHHGTGDLGIHRAREFQYAAADHFRGHGVAAGGPRDIRIDVVCGGAADTGDRHSRGAGRQRRRHAADGDRARSAAGGDRTGGGVGRGVRPYAAALGPAIRREGQRPHGIRRGGGHAGGGGLGGSLYSGAPGHAHRSTRGAALRVRRGGGARGAEIRQRPAMESGEDARIDAHQPPGQSCVEREHHDRFVALHAAQDGARGVGGGDQLYWELCQQLVLIDVGADSVLVDGRVHKAGTRHAYAHAETFGFRAQCRGQSHYGALRH